MRYFLALSVISLGLLLTACVPPSTYRSYDTYNYTPPVSFPPIAHNYELNIVDIDNIPIAGAKVEYALKNNGSIKKKEVFTTASDGKLTVSLDANADTTTYSTLANYKTEFSYLITANNYYQKSGLMKSDYGSCSKPSKYSQSRSFANDPQSQADKVTLYKPNDYFVPSFLNSEKDSTLTKKTFAFIDLIRLQSLLTDSYLNYRSIDIAEFKGKKYLKFKFTNGLVYNSLKLNKYDIAKNIFDEVIRKVLNPLNEHISDPKKFYGYDLSVVGYTKSFAEKYASNQSIEYRFLIPESAVKSYKEKDISGQQLLDKSVILMNDERIELKLQ